MAMKINVSNEGQICEVLDQVQRKCTARCVDYDEIGSVVQGVEKNWRGRWKSRKNIGRDALSTTCQAMPAAPNIRTRQRVRG